MHLRGSKLELVPGAGHLLLLEDFDTTLSSIRRALVALSD